MHARLLWLVLATTYRGAKSLPALHAEHAEHSPLQPQHAAAEPTLRPAAEAPVADVGETFPLTASAWESFRSTIRGCEYEPSGVSAAYDRDDTTTSKVLDHMQSDSIGLDACSTTDDHGERWVVGRLGPFVSSGGWDWHSTEMRHWPAVTALLAAHGEFWVTAISVLTVTADGTLLTFPPIHNHHSHAYLNASDWYLNQLMLHHQDRVCQHGLEHGYGCMLTQFPGGLGLRIDQAVAFDGMFNDVREANSSTMTWYCELAMRVSTPPHATKKSLQELDVWCAPSAGI